MPVEIESPLVHCLPLGVDTMLYGTKTGVFPLIDVGVRWKAVFFYFFLYNKTTCIGLVGLKDKGLLDFRSRENFGHSLPCGITDMSDIFVQVADIPLGNSPA